jgi:hypothetical protein
MVLHLERFFFWTETGTGNEPSAIDLELRNSKLGSFKSSDHFRLGRGARSIELNLSHEPLCVKLLQCSLFQVQHADKKDTKRAADLLFEFKSSLKRGLETRVNEAKSVGEENVKFLFLDSFGSKSLPPF